MTLMWDGQATKDIAERLGLSPSTVEAHRASMFKKCGVRNAAQLFIHLLHAGVLAPPTPKPRRPR